MRALVHWPIETDCEIITVAEIDWDGHELRVEQKTSGNFAGEHIHFENNEVDTKALLDGTVYLQLDDPSKDRIEAKMSAPMLDAIRKAGLKTRFSSDIVGWTPVTWAGDRAVLYRNAKAACLIHAIPILTNAEHQGDAVYDAASLLDKSDISELEPYATGGDAKAQEAIGWLSIKAACRERDYPAAVRWFTLAANSGDKAAIKELEEIDQGRAQSDCRHPAD